jgi:peptidyl-prolyl cis-trans isomerase C
MIGIRSLSICLSVFLVLLGLSGCAGSSRGGKTSASGGPRVWSPSQPGGPGTTLAMVGGRRITSRDVDSVLATAPANLREEYLQDPEQYKVLLERIVQQEAVYMAAQKAGTENDSGYVVELASQKRQILMKHYYQNALRALPAVPDTAVRNYYDTHSTEFAMPGRARVRHILVPTQAKAREVVKRLRSESWVQVCSRYSTDKLTVKNDGILGFVSTDTDQVPGIGKAPAIVAAAFKLKEGETSEPLKTSRGWHVIRADQKTEAGPQPFAAVEKQIRAGMESERSENFQTVLLDSLKRTYGVIVYTDSISVAMEPRLSPAELFAKAQGAPSPHDRIDLFKQVVSKYPNDKTAVQADFMIGFTYAEELRDYPAAREAFQGFIRRHPKSDLIASANWMLENMEHSVPPPEVGVPDTLNVETGPGLGPAHKGSNTKP